MEEKESKSKLSKDFKLKRIDLNVADYANAYNNRGEAHREKGELVLSQRCFDR